MRDGFCDKYYYDYIHIIYTINEVPKKKKKEGKYIRFELFFAVVVI